MNVCVINIGIAFSGLDSPLSIGQSATIKCITNIPVTSIEWRDQSSAVLNSTTNKAVLEYTIPLVTDDLHGWQVTCVVAVVGAALYTVNETVEINVEGEHIYIYIIVSCVFYTVPFSSTC